jgi:hypothetical protein
VRFELHYHREQEGLCLVVYCVQSELIWRKQIFSKRIVALSVVPQTENSSVATAVARTPSDFAWKLNGAVFGSLLLAYHTLLISAFNTPPQKNPSSSQLTEYFDFQHFNSFAIVLNSAIPKYLMISSTSISWSPLANAVISSVDPSFIL